MDLACKHILCQLIAYFLGKFVIVVPVVPLISYFFILK